MAFWQFSWEFMKNKVMNFFREFHESGRFVWSLNATFLVLIPKKGGAEDLRVSDQWGGGGCFIFSFFTSHLTLANPSKCRMLHLFGYFRN